ncbi:MAG: phenol hydroxylase subunit [Acidovorax soli]|nr:phenol hydroxylase subunit [Acidovorax soli]MCM2345185.1 phenol hydroxylase subunit [Acidovorax soli]
MEPAMNPEPLATDSLQCDVSRKFVRVLKRRDNGFIEFEFSIGWPELAVELMLPQRAFEAFCRAQQVRPLGDPIDDRTTTIV